MAGTPGHLHVVSRTDPPSGRRRLADHDLGLTLAIFLVAAIPLASTFAGLGVWDERSLGLGTLGVLFAGRELLAPLVARLRRER
jgi:hypothetical protein